MTLSHKAFIFAEIVQLQSPVSELRILSSIPSHKNILNWDFKSPHQERHVLFQLYMSHKLSVSLGFVCMLAQLLKQQSWWFPLEEERSNLDHSTWNVFKKTSCKYWRLFSNYITNRKKHVSVDVLTWCQGTGHQSYNVTLDTFPFQEKLESHLKNKSSNTLKCTWGNFRR